MNRRLTAWLPGILAVGLVTALQWRWLAFDHAPAAGDDVEVYRMSVCLGARLDDGFWTAISACTPASPYPPLVPLAGVLAYSLLGNHHYDTAGFSLLPFVFLLAASTWFGAARSGDRAGAVVATVLAPTLWYHAGERGTFYTEVAVAAFLLTTMAAYAASDGFRKFGAIIALGTALGLGLLSKWSFAFFAGPALIVAATYHLAVGPQRARAILGLAVACGIALALAGPWYWFEHKRIAQFLTQNVSGIFDGEPVGPAESWPWYPASSLTALGLAMSALAAIGAGRAAQRKDAFTLICLLAFAAGTVTLTLAPYRSLRYLACGFPLLAPAIALIDPRAALASWTRLAPVALLRALAVLLAMRFEGMSHGFFRGKPPAPQTAGASANSHAGIASARDTLFHLRAPIAPDPRVAMAFHTIGDRTWRAVERLTGNGKPVGVILHDAGEAVNGLRTGVEGVELPPGSHIDDVSPRRGDNKPTLAATIAGVRAQGRSVLVIIGGDDATTRAAAIMTVEAAGLTRVWNDNERTVRVVEVGVWTGL